MAATTASTPERRGLPLGFIYGAVGFALALFLAAITLAGAAYYVLSDNQLVSKTELARLQGIEAASTFTGMPAKGDRFEIVVETGAVLADYTLGSLQPGHDITLEAMGTILTDNPSDAKQLIAFKTSNGLKILIPASEFKKLKKL